MPQPTTQRRWTEDTRIAFLLALRLTGGVRAAAAEIGRDVPGCYKWRDRDSGFAAAWDAIMADQRKARRAARLTPDAVVRTAAAPLPELDAANQRKRRDGVTQVKRRAFLRGLSESGTVAAACAAAGVSDTAVYNLRARDADFAAAWDRALRTSGPALDQIAWERAVEGWEEPVFAGGKQVGTRWRHSPGLLRDMIRKRETSAALANDPAALRARAEEAARAAGGCFGTPATWEETSAAIIKSLKMARLRLDRQRAAAAAKADDEAGTGVPAGAGVGKAEAEQPRGAGGATAE